MTKKYSDLRRKRRVVIKGIGVVSSIIIAIIIVIIIASGRQGKKQTTVPLNTTTISTSTTTATTATTVTTTTTTATTITTTLSTNPVQRVKQFYGENPKTVWGIDISNYQLQYVDGDFLDRALRNGLSFVIIEVQRNRTGLEDLSESALYFAQLCEERNIPFGWYALVGSVNEQEAYKELQSLNDFLFAVDEKFSMNVFPTAIDIEADSENFDERCKWGQWIARRTKMLNKEIMFYTSASRVPELELRGPEEFIWVAHYKDRQDEYSNSSFSQKLLDQIVIWQYTDDDRLKEDWGLEYPADLDRDLMRIDFFLDHVE